jgi:hypothetical protein
MCKNRGTEGYKLRAESRKIEKYSVRVHITYFLRAGREEIKVERVLSPFGFSVTLLFAP